MNLIVKSCTKCGETKPFPLFAAGRASCKECEKARLKIYYARPEVKAAKAISRRAHYQLNRESEQKRCAERRKYVASPKNRTKEAARDAVNVAVRNGKLIKLKECQDCGASGNLHGHHEDYSRPLVPA